MTCGMTKVILHCMKTAISIPDDVFRAADRVAKRLRVSRSQLYASAVARFVAEQPPTGKEITKALDAVYAKDSSRLDPALAAMQAASLGRQDW